MRTYLQRKDAVYSARIRRCKRIKMQAFCPFTIHITNPLLSITIQLGSDHGDVRSDVTMSDALEK